MRIKLHDTHGIFLACRLPDDPPQVGNDSVPLGCVIPQLLPGGKSIVWVQRKGITMNGDDVHQVGIHFKELGQVIDLGKVKLLPVLIKQFKGIETTLLADKR
jgi:hypothetical protein